MLISTREILEDRLVGKYIKFIYDKDYPEFMLVNGLDLVYNERYDRINVQFRFLSCDVILDTKRVKKDLSTKYHYIEIDLDSNVEVKEDNE